MYGLVTFIAYRDSQDPKLQRMELFTSLEQAVDRANDLMASCHRQKVLCLCMQGCIGSI